MHRQVGADRSDEPGGPNVLNKHGVDARLGDGSRVNIRSTAATPKGLLVSIVVNLPRHASPSDAAEAMHQLHDAPQDVFAPASFGTVSVTAADVAAAGSAATPSCLHREFPASGS